MLADEKAAGERLAQERDNAEKTARQNETKVSTSVKPRFALDGLHPQNIFLHSTLSRLFGFI